MCMCIEVRVYMYICQESDRKNAPENGCLTQSCVWLWIMTHSYVWHTCECTRQLMCDLTHSYVWPDSLVRFLKSHCITLRHTATHWDTLQHIATHCNTLQHTAFICITWYIGPLFDNTASICNTLQRTETQCNTLQHAATHYIHVWFDLLVRCSLELRYIISICNI